MKIIDTLLNTVTIGAFLLLTALLTVDDGLIGFFIGMGFSFTVLCVFVAIMTLVERLTTGDWWFLNDKNRT